MNLRHPGSSGDDSCMVARFASASRAARPRAWALVERLKTACSAEQSAESERWAMTVMSAWPDDDAEAFGGPTVTPG